MPEVARDNTDRNRTSPFAFTGNKFEFRAVSSAASISTPIAFLNAAVAEALGEFEQAIASRTGKGMSLQDAALEVVREAVVQTKAVRFEGNNYAAEWVEEARRRGIPNLRTSPEALAELVKPEAKEFMARMKVFSEAETDARYHVRMERYVKDVEIEIEAAEEHRDRPRAARGLQAARAAGAGGLVQDGQGGALAHGRGGRGRGRQGRGPAGRGRHAPRARPTWCKKSRLLADEVVPAMAALREVCDRIEEMVADEFWTLPKYSEMLFLV